MDKERPFTSIDKGFNSFLLVLRDRDEQLSAEQAAAPASEMLMLRDEHDIYIIDPTRPLAPFLTCVSMGIMKDSRSALLFLFGIVVLGSRLPPVMDDPDLWWHLATGRWILEEGHLPWTDPFSHTAAGLSWLAYSWLPDLFFLALERGFGLVAFPWLIAVLCLLTHLLVIDAAWFRTRRFLPSMAVGLLCFLTTYPYWNERPQIFSFLLLSVLCLGLEQIEKGYRRPLLWIPCLFCLWSNVHIYFPLGWFVLAVKAVWSLIYGYRQGSAHGPWIWITLLGFSVLATLINPYHIHLHLYLARLLFHLHSMAISEEMGSLFSRMDVTTMTLLFSLLFLVSVRHTRRPWEALSLFVPLFLLSLTQLKLVPFLVLGTSGRLAEGLSGYSWLRLPVNQDSTLMQRRVRAFSCLVGSIWLLGRIPIISDVKQALEKAHLPRGACQVLAHEIPPGTLFNEIDEGGYLLYRLYPRWQVFVDPRNHLYALVDGFHENYIQHTRGDRDSALEWVDSFSVDTALVRRGGRWNTCFASDPAWTTVYEDDIYLLLRKKP